MGLCVLRSLRNDRGVRLGLQVVSVYSWINHSYACATTLRHLIGFVIHPLVLNDILLADNERAVMARFVELDGRHDLLLVLIGHHLVSLLN